MSTDAHSEDLYKEKPTVNATLLKSRGWISFTLPCDSESELRERLSEIAAKLGAPVAHRMGGPFCDTLTPIQSINAPPRSLSKINGTGEFPLHTDTAHWLTPCRYIVLACAHPGYDARATFLLDTQKVCLTDSQVDLLHSTPLRVTNGRRSFFSSILSKARRFARFDQACMTPISPEGAEALGIYSRHKWNDRIEVVHWNAGRVVVIDNWRMLHGREGGEVGDPTRRLLRYSIQ